MILAAAAPAAAPAGGDGTLIVLNKAASTAWLIPLNDPDKPVSIETGDGPHEVAVSPDGKTAVIGNYGSQTPGNTLTVVDVPSARVSRTIDLGRFQRPHGLSFLPDGQHLLVTAEAQQALLTVDLATGTVIGAIGTDQEISHMVARTPDGKRAFVANIRSDSVSVIDLANGRLLKILTTGKGAEGVDVSPDGAEVWITNRADDTIVVVDTATLATRATIPCASFPIRLKFTPDGRHVLVSNARSGDVAVFDAGARREIARIPMTVKASTDKEGRLFQDRFGDSPVPIGIQVHPDGTRAWVANSNADRVMVIDLSSWQVTGEIPTGKEPDGLGYSPF
jgi:YVTN family beta-propeller protein